MAPKAGGKAEAAAKETKPVAKKAEEAKEEALVDAEMKAEEPKEATEATEATEAKDAEMKAEEPAEAPAPEEPKELEQDATPSAGPKVGPVSFFTEDTTLNVLPATNGKLLTCLSDGGFQYLLAGARASVGIKAGRYMFEVSIAENKNPSEPAGARQQGPKPRNLVRVGVSTSSAGLLLADSTESVFFDSEGFFQHGRQRSKAGGKFAHNQVAAVVLNLDPSSPNANTISLFVAGVRASKPMPLPESLRGKVLFPAITYRNVTLQVHFGPQPLRPLPFKCTTLVDASAAHVEVTKQVPAPKDGKHEVVVPVGLPDEGTFDWLDRFLAANRGYMELSDRAILEWAAKSGLQRPAKRSCNDKPEYGFGLPLMDDQSISRVLAAVAPALPRNFVVMEVKGNLLAEDRKATVARFSGPGFRTVAQVAVGEPSAEYKAWVQQSLLDDKKAKALAELRKKKAEEARKKAEEEKRKKFEEERKKKLEALKKAREPKKEGEEAEAEKKEEEVKPAEAEEPKAEEAPEEEEEVKVSLTEEEKNLLFRKHEVPDLLPKDLATSYIKFSVPEKEEGFDSIVFAWQPEAKAREYVQNWVQEKKLTQRVEELQPGEWFKGKWGEWTKLLAVWRRKQADFKDPAKRKAAALAKKKELEAKRKEAGEDAEMEEVKEVNADDLDVFAVEDVTDIGNGEPLFMNFQFEDWTLASLRLELHLLVHSFRRDLDDPQRTNFHESHLAFYYNKYFKKPFNVKYFGVEKISELVDMVKDTVQINKTNHTLEHLMEEDTPMENFVKLTEDHRRDRQRRVDAGDETASLKFTRPSPAAPKQPQQPAKPGAGYYSAAGPAARGTFGQPAAAAGQKRPYSATTAGSQGSYSSAYQPAKQPRASSAYDRDAPRPSVYSAQASSSSSWRGGGYGRY